MKQPNQTNPCPSCNYSHISRDLWACPMCGAQLSSANRLPSANRQSKNLSRNAPPALGAKRIKVNVNHPNQTGTCPSCYYSGVSHRLQACPVCLVRLPWADRLSDEAPRRNFGGVLFSSADAISEVLDVADTCFSIFSILGDLFGFIGDLFGSIGELFVSL